MDCWNWDSLNFVQFLQQQQNKLYIFQMINKCDTEVIGEKKQNTFVQKVTLLTS